jgi:hypothetical protein
VEKQAGISRHGFSGLMTAMRTGQRALQDEISGHAVRQTDVGEKRGAFAIPDMSFQFSA